MLAIFRFAILAAFSSLLCAAAQEVPISQPPLWNSKPDVGAFEKIENGRLAGAHKSIDQILAVKGPRTVNNTLLPFDEANRELNAASDFAGLMQQVHPDKTFRDRATLMTTTVNSAITALSLNRDVYNALTALDVSHADPATSYYVKRQLLEFRLAGVDRDTATRGRLQKLNDQLTDE